jgi:hypothetical protein
MPCCGPTGPTPFGGAASGLYPGGARPAAAPARSAAASPSPAPAPQCQVATLFSDCFTNGNVGWTVLTPAGTVTFTGGKLNEGSSAGNSQGEAQKALPVLPAGAWTATFKLTEVAAAPSGNKDYAIGAFDAAGNSVWALAVFGDGTAFIGDASTIYSFTWTPAAGATHTFLMTRTAGGTLSLFIDGAPIVLTFVAPIPISNPTPNVVDASITNNDLDGMGAYDEIFMTDGIVDPSALRFCCPGESP